MTYGWPSRVSWDTSGNNLNTTIVGRHRNLKVLRDALPVARPEMLEQADKLAPGEMLVDLFGTPSLLHVKMDLSRSRLTVPSDVERSPDGP